MGETYRELGRTEDQHLHKEAMLACFSVTYTLRCINLVFSSTGATFRKGKGQTESLAGRHKHPWIPAQCESPLKVSGKPSG